MEEDAWIINRLFSQAYASLCVAFYLMEFDRDFSSSRNLVLSLTLISLFLCFEVHFITLRTMHNLSVGGVVGK